MLDDYEIANMLGSERAEGGAHRLESSVIYGIAVEDSANGTVRVVPNGEVYSDNGDNSIVIATSPSVKAGDTVQISLLGGVSKTPMVTAVSGEGDWQNFRIGAIEADYVKASTLDADVANIGYLKATSATITDLQAQTAKVQNLTAEQLEAASGYIGDLQAENIEASDIIADHAAIEELDVQSMAVAVAYIDDLTAGNVTASDIVADHGFVDDLSAGSVTASQINAAAGYVGSLTAGNVTAANLVADHGIVGNLSTTYAQIDAANITDLTTKNAWVDKLMVQTGLIAHEGTIYTLDAIQLNADRITAGTIDVERLVVTVDGEKYLVHIDTSGSTPVTSYEKLDGDIIEDLTITADKIVAGAITAEKITTENIIGTGGWINLRSGTFAYGNASSGDYIAWDGSNLTIRAASLNLSSYATKKQLEESSNLLYDTDVSSVTKVNGPSNRYFSDTGNTMISTSFESLSDPPKSGIKYAAQFVCTGTQTAKKGRGLRFYANGSGNLIPLAAGQAYTATWWGRCTSGTAMTRVLYNNGVSGSTYNLTSTWKQYSQTFTIETLSSSVYVYFYCDFPANTAGTVQLCGFRLVAGDSAENVSAELSVQADKIAMVVDDSTTSSSLVLTSQAMGYIGDHVEIKGPDGTSTVISGGQIQANSIALGAMTTAAQNDILNSNIHVGGTNLLRRTGSPAIGNMADGYWAKWVANDTVEKTADGIKITCSGSVTSFRIPLVYEGAISVGETLTLSFDYRGDMTGVGSLYMMCSPSPNVAVGMNALVESTTNWVHFEQTFSFSGTGGGPSVQFMFPYKAQTGKWFEIKDGTLKLERGNKATDWSPAPEDQTAYVDSTVNAIEVGGTNLVMGTGDYNGWIFNNAAVTKSGNILDINVSGQTSNTFYRGRGWLSVPFATLKETAPTVIVSVEVFSDDWSAVTSDLATGFASASVQLCTVMGDIGSQTAGETKRYRYLGLHQTDKWQSIPAMENGKWLKFVSIPIEVPDGFISDVSKGDGTNVTADLMLRRNGHVRWRNLKVEAGNKATAWSPAPEDYDAAIAAAQTTANAANERAVAYRGTNNTASNTAAKTIVCKNFALVTGATVSVYNQASNSVAGTLTLNVNGTGAKTIYIGAESTSATNQLLWHIGSTITYSYDGAYWHVADMPSNYYGTSCSTAAGTAQKQTTIPAGVIFKGVQLELPMQYANTAATPTLAVQNANNTASNLVNGILYGTGTIKPLVSNGYSWLAGMSVIFRFDGQYWRTGNQTIIDGGHILTGTISADRIAASSIAVGKLTVEAQSTMLNSNIEVGGTNLLPKTHMLTYAMRAIPSDGRYERTCTNGRGFGLAHTSDILAPLVPDSVGDGDDIVVSFDFKLDENGVASHNLHFYAYQNNGVSIAGDFSLTADEKTFGWVRVSRATKAHRYADNGTNTIGCIYFYDGTGNNYFTIRNVKIERGNKATDWSPAPEDMASAADSIEYIVGTQSAATGSWTGVTKESALVAGKTIAYRLPYAGSGNASLNLTLAGGGTTGAKAVYSMTTRVTTHYPANSIIQMTYDGSNWRTTGWYNTDTNARYVQFYNTIVAKSAIRAASIIGGDSSGYEEATAGAVFDLSYPILWCTAAIAAEATNYANIYTLTYDRNLATCYSSFTGSANKVVYLVGTASGNKFTVDSSIITCTEPTTEDGKVYIPIGRLGNQSTGKNYFNFSVADPVTPYAYLGGAFQRVDLSTSVRVSDVEDGLELAVSDIATVTDAANAANDGVSSLNTRVNAQEETITQVKTTFTFSTTGLTIGKSGSSMTSTFGNTSLQFKSGNTTVLELDAAKSTARADRFAIGKYQLKSIGDGSAIAIVYVGG